MLAEFDLVVPGDLDETLDLVAGGEGVMALAGGTNLVVDLRAGRLAPATLVGLGRIPGLRRIERRDGRVAIGAGTTITDLLSDPEMAADAPSLVEAARWFGGQMVRNAATVAGNVCYGSPAADIVPPLLVLDAEVTLQSKAGGRVVALADFFLGYKQDVRRPDELMIEIAWNRPSGRSVDRFYKLARRKGDAITVVGLAVSVGAEAGKCTKARIALGAVAPMVKRATAAERMLVGEPLTPALIEAAARRAVEEAEPIDDVRASAEYRRHGVHVLTRRLLTQAWDRVA